MRSFFFQRLNFTNRDFDKNRKRGNKNRLKIHIDMTIVLENSNCFLATKIKIMIKEDDRVVLFKRILTSSQNGNLFVYNPSWANMAIHIPAK